MSTAPLPAKLVLLENLPGLERGDKVRFLGCVSAPYCASTGQLPLQCPMVESYESQDANKSESRKDKLSLKSDEKALQQLVRPLTVMLDISLVDTKDSGCRVVDIGTWLNVIGYISFDSNGDALPTEKIVHVQALSIWSAGSFDPLSYIQAVKARELASQLLESIERTD